MNLPMTIMPGLSMIARERLADPAYGRSVAAMVRRRVPASDADDITQTVLCDALDAPRLPAEPAELRRFLCVLARNKIADFYRRSRRYEPSSDPTETATCEPPPMEARVLLDRVVHAASPRDRETLGWLVREHDGEQFAEIADSAGLPPCTVRQRVSRLRRALRTQWSHALALLLLAGSCGVAVERFRETGVSITADPAVDPGARVLGLAQGSWRIDEGSAIELEPGNVIEPRVVELRVHGRRVEVFAPLHVATFTIASAAATGGATYALELRDDVGRVQRASVVVTGETMLMTLHEGRVRGTVRLTKR